MITYTPADFLVFGVNNYERETPHVQQPVLYLPQEDLLFLSYDTTESNLIIPEPEGLLPLSDLDDYLGEASEFFYRFPLTPFQRDHCAYLPSMEEGGNPEYISLTETLKRLRAFSDTHRLKGDAFYKVHNLPEALNEYILCVSVSQSPTDYALVYLLDTNDQYSLQCITDSTKPEHSKSLEAILKEAEQRLLLLKNP